PAPFGISLAKLLCIALYVYSSTIIYLFDYSDVNSSLQSMRRKKTSSSALGSSTAVEDYLERILELINSKGYARVVDIAAALKISQASVTNIAQRLDAEGLLKYEKEPGIMLTDVG